MDETTEFETGESVETPGADPAPVEQEVPSRFFDPAPFYEQLPSQYKDSKVLDPIFDKYENAYKEALGKYQPYEPFTQHQPEVLAAAVQLFDMIDTPEGARQIYDQIAKVLDITPAQAQQVVEQAVEESEEPEELDPVQQELAELREWKNEQENRYQQQLLKERTAINGSALDKAVNDLYTVDPTLKGDTQRLGDLMERVYTLNERNPEAPFGTIVKQAFDSQRAYNQHLYDTLVSGQRTGNKTAPVVMSPSGSNPGSGVDPASRDENARKEAMVEALRRSRVPS